MGTALSKDARARLDAAAAGSPSWRPYLDLVRAVLEEDASGRFDAVHVTLADGRPADAPLLAGATVGVPEREAARFVAHVVGAKVAKRLDPVALLEAAARQDAAALAATAGPAGVPADGLEALAGLAVSPCLRACARTLAPRVPRPWPHGFCPVCGAWPALAELRGLERERRLRCGRCAADWGFSWLRCPHCGEADEKALSRLLLEGDGSGKSVETCGTCHGYLKSISTLSALDPASLALADLETVDLDLAAQQRGRRPPTSPAAPGSVRLVAAREARR